MSEQKTSTGRYDVTAELGRGSMGIVCLAHDPVMGRDLAIKTILLPHGLPADQRFEFQKRFLREAQAAGRLSHPGIVTVYDYSQDNDDELPFIAMEYVPGYTLHELIQRDGPLDPKWATDMADTLADALQTAHNAGVIHRDLKPANVLVRESDGAAKITDFGIARVSSSELTQAGTTYGSPGYMAPERIRGERADARSDLYSLAVILYEALCCERPFVGEDYTSLCYAIVNEPAVPIRTRQPELSIAFEAFFRRALSKDPDERFQDGASFRKGLESVRMQQRRFETGAATLKMMVPEPGAETEGAGAGDPIKRTEDSEDFEGSEDHGDDSIREIPWKWVAIGATAVLLVLLSFVAGWGLRPGAIEATDSPARAASGAAATEASEAQGAVTEGAALASTEGGAEDGDAAVADSAGTETANAVVESPEPAPARNPIPAEPEIEDVEQPVDFDPGLAAADDPNALASEGDVVAAAEFEPQVPEDFIAVPEPPVETAPGVEPVAVGVNVRNNIKEGTLTILVDGDEVYAVGLSTESGQKLKGAYKKVLGKGQQTVETEVELPAGSHTITALAYSTSKERQYETSLDVELEPGDLRTLKIVAGRTFGKQLTMKLD